MREEKTENATMWVITGSSYSGEIHTRWIDQNSGLMVRGEFEDNYSVPQDYEVNNNKLVKAVQSKATISYDIRNKTTQHRYWVSDVTGHTYEFTRNYSNQNSWVYKVMHAIEIGDWYPWKITDYSPQVLEIVLISVPAGTFTCWKIKSIESEHQYYNDYYDVNTGILVRHENLVNTNGQWGMSDKKELKRFLFSGDVLTKRISVTPTALVFGSVDVRRTADLAITVQNIGSGTLTGSCNTAAPFSLPNGCSFNLGPGQSAVVTVRFSPTAIGPITGNVEFTSNMGNASIDLSGTGAQSLAGISLSTNNLSFGTQAIGSTGTAKPVTITNNSTSLVRFGIVNLTGTNTSDFFFNNDRDCSYQALRPKDSCTIVVVFKPSAPGERIATITIRSDATGSPHSVQLSGTGAEAKVLLLLHGMNSSPSTWDVFVGANFSLSCPVVYGYGEIIEDAVPNPNGVYCYRLMFGSLDSRSGRLGLENAFEEAKKKSNNSGDFETIEQLGIEVKNGIKAIKKRHPYAGIVLVGHSRGGIAGRVFLQTDTYPDRSSSQSF